ncbi:hypothetical protein D5R81_19765 [Parashewanella spongiae]|uniref:Uncharacterized protein n=1 Tax=Parashewanella spongiae TaxID=342950 RepID=A0A3A6T1Y3_9GAMM|nr:hypothetical protein [Parashewanella spongiae]MCL1080265.1 hypothetical protein [Parashewanella spongiae]RJY01837.1 hypothetical protein D5R81_19765 [Parashewanella spongiae]
MKLPFSKLEHDSLQLVVWASRFFFMFGSVFILSGIGKEIYRVVRWLLSPIHFSDGSWASYRYKLDLTHINWQLILLGLILTFISCWLAIKLNSSRKKA